MAALLLISRLRIQYCLLVLMIAASSTMLSACGSSADDCVMTCTSESDDDDDDDSDDDDDEDSEETETGISYYPLAVYEQAISEYNDLDASAFIRDTSDPFIFNYLIVPVDSQTLEATDEASVDDYLVTVDGTAIETDESFPILQPVLGYQINLLTALVIDTSSSMDSADKDALISELKAYLAAASNSSNSSIASQGFSVWAYADATHISCMASSFSNDLDTLEGYLDEIQTNWEAQAYGRTSATYQAVVEAIGQYNGDGSYSDSTGYDFSSNGCPDLDADTELDSMTLKNVVLISSGSNTVGGFDIDAVETALSWQTKLTYDTSSDDYASAYLNTPLYYVALEGDSDDDLAELSESVLTATLSSGSYSFADSLVSAQLDGLEERTQNGDNIYVYRYAYLPRDGEHAITFESQTSYYDFDLEGTVDLTDGSSASIGTPEQELDSLVEITGANDEYLANGVISLADITTLYPATRWTTVEYDGDDYYWTVDGIERSADSDGAITLTSSDSGSIVTLTNTTLGHSTYLTVTD